MHISNISENILKSMNEPLYVRDKEKRILFINNAAEKITGWTLNEALGKKCYDIFGDDKGSCKHLCPPDKAIKNNEFITHDEGNLVTRSGKIIVMKASITPLRKNQEVVGAIVLLEDISQLIEIQKTNVKTLMTLEKEIEERKRVEKILEKSQEQLRASQAKSESILRVAPHGIGVVKNRLISFVSDSFLEMVGYTREELIGKDSRIVYPSDEEFKRVEKEFYKEIEKKASGKVETELKHKNGRIIEVDIRSTLLDPEDITAGVTFTIIDITERKQVERILRIQRDLSIALSSTSNLMEALNLILKSITKIEGIDSGCIYLIDQRTGSLYIAEQLGFTDEFLKKVSYIEANDPRTKFILKGKPLYSPIDRVTSFKVSSPSTREKILSIGIIPVKYEKKIIAVLNAASHTHKNIPTNACSSLEAIATQIGSVISRIRIEKALKENQQNFQNLFNTMDDFVFILDHEGFIIHTNPIVKKRLGYSEIEVQSMHVSELHHLDKRDEANIILNNILMETISTSHLPLQSKDGKEIPVETRTIKGRWGNENVIFCVSRDLTERLKSEEEKLTQEKQRQRFIETTSHELRTPVTSIKGFLDIIKNRADSLSLDQKNHCFEIIEKNITRLESLLYDISDLSKIERGIFELNKEVVNFREFVEEEVKIYSNLLNTRFEFKSDISESELLLEIDKNRISQVLANIINNAVKQTHPETSKIIMNLKTDDPSFIRIEIIDNGIGIEEKNLERIFEPFVSIETEYKTGGTGIGLYLCRLFMNAHGGSITAFSEGIKKGSTFTIDLPIDSLLQK